MVFDRETEMLQAFPPAALAASEEFLAAASVAPPDFSAVLDSIKPLVAGAIRALCRRAGRDRYGDDGVIFEGLADALPGWNPHKGPLAARIVFFAHRNLQGELPTNAESIDDDAEDMPLQIAGGIDPLKLLEALEAAEADPAWLSRQMSDDDTSGAIARAANVSRRTAQRRLRAARHASTTQAALF